VTTDQAIERIQFCYPRVYYACHTRHVRRRSSDVHLSWRDSEVLVHLDRKTPMTLTTLARHMALSPSTLSAAIAKLESYGYVSKAVASGGDRRRISLLLTPKGVAAVRATSVLEADRLRAVLMRLTRKDRDVVVDGLTRLAAACGPAILAKGRSAL
jgi:DNA-binding MarR family transcriptional regulator